MSEDALVTILKRDGVLDYIKSKKELLNEMFCSIIHTYQKMYPGQQISLKIIGPLIWCYLRWDIKVRNVFVIHQFDMSELERYGGPISTVIIEEVLRILEMDFGSINVKRGEEK